MRHGLFGLLLRIAGFHVHDTHGHTQFERIGEFDPLGVIAGVNQIVTLHGLQAGIALHEVGQLVDHVVQIVEKPFVELVLRIVGHGDRVSGDFGVGYRAVLVGHAVHGRNAQQLRPSELLALAAGQCAKLEPRGVDVGKDVVESRVEPRQRRVESRVVLLPAVVGGSHVAAEGVADQVLAELVLVLLDRNHVILHLHDEQARAVIVGFEVLVRRFVGVVVDVLEVTGSHAERRRESQKTYA